MSLQFGTDGIRGVAGVDLTPEIALAVGRSAAEHLGGRGFLVGADTRRSSPMLKAAVCAGLAGAGAEVFDVGVLPTPGLAWLCASRQLPAVMISASHNPYSDNGIKLLSERGSKLPVAIERAIELDIAEPSRKSPPSREAVVGDIHSDLRAIEEYAEYLIGSIGGFLERPLRVVCDCANGASFKIAPMVFERLGCEVITVAASPDGININEKCGSTHPELVIDAVRRHHADLGLSFDGDADRLIAVDGDGEIVDGDRLLAMFATDLHERGELDHDTIAVTVMSNLGLKKALENVGISLVETPVGDRHVAEALELHHLVLGGEQSGHIVFRRHAGTGDGILSALMLLSLLDRKKIDLASIARDAMVRFPQELRAVKVDDPARVSDMAEVWDEVAAVEALLASSGRVLLRASGTELAVRVMVEAEDQAVAKQAVDRLVAVVQESFARDQF